jgi:hypothetical protein
MSEKKVKEDTTKDVKFTKEQILGSTKFNLIERDILRALLKENAGYSLDEANKLLKEFNDKEVK